MKIIRFRDDTGCEHVGVWQAVGAARRTDGDVFGDYTVTGDAVTIEIGHIGRLTTPVALEA